MSRSDGRGSSRRIPSLPREAIKIVSLYIGLAYLLVGSLAASQTAKSAPAIPEPGFAPGWAKAGPLRTFVGQDLFNQIDGGAELFLESGFVRLRLQSYARGKAELTLNAYEMEGPSSALAIYLMKMGRETPFPEVEARNSSEEVQLTILKGRYFVQVDNLGEAAASRGEAAALANVFLAGVAGETAPTPLDVLSADGKVAGSERLIRGPYGLQPYFTFGEGDILSLGGRVFGALAAYRMPDGPSYTRLVVPYPDPAAAAAALAHLRANLDPYLKVTADRPDGFDFTDFQEKKGRVARSGAVLDILFSLPSAAPMPSLLPLTGGLAMDLGPKIPDQVLDWKASGEDAVYDRKTLYDYMDGGAEVYLAFDFRRVFVRKYADAAANEIVLDVYDMGSPAEAFGMFSCDRQDPAAGIGQGSEYGLGLLRFWRGRYFVSITVAGDEDKAEKAVLDLGKAVVPLLGPDGAPPALLAALPAEGLKADRVSYFHDHVHLSNRYYVSSENVLGLDAKTECAFGEYALAGRESARLLVVRYPTAERARAAEASFRKAFLPAAGADGTALTDKKTWSAVRTRENILAAVFEATSTDYAGRLAAAALRPAK
jgi:hypothetical protein